MARYVILGALALIAIGIACGDDDLPPRAMDLGSDGVPPGVTDTSPGDAGVPDGAVAADGATLATCRTVEAGSGVNELDFDDASLAFAPLSATARFREDCVAPGRMQLVLTESPTCSPGAREVVVDLPPTAAVGQTLQLDGLDEVGVRFDDSDGTRFSNLGDCAVSTGAVTIESYDASEAGAVQRVTLELAQLYDCSLAARGPLVISGTIEAPLEATFEVACPGG